MTLAELRQEWTKIDARTLEHKTQPDTQIHLIPGETGRSGRHYIVRVKGQWIMQGKFIRPFWTLAAAVQAVGQ